MKDHFISHTSNKEIGKNMFDSLVDLFQNSHASRQMLLRNQLSIFHMSKIDIAVK